MKTQEYSQFLVELEEKTKVEDKLKFCLNFMREALSSEKTPAFRDFWETKRLCLEFFKEKLSPRVRTVYWAEYAELSDAIRRVKEILDEQSSFAHEQIELAISAVGKDLDVFAERLGEMASLELPKEAKTLEKNGPRYIQTQKELDLFNTFAGRLNGLRKELIHTQMRIRYKNRLFDQLNQLGDRVFPKRKQLIKEVSEFFTQDVELFVSGFKLGEPPFFGFKEEIKALQGFAKQITLNTPAFSQIRETLSGCWDQIKEKEHVLHEKRAQEREAYKENFEKISPQIEALKEGIAQEKISLKEADEMVEALLLQMRELELGREEVKTLKKRLFAAKKPLEEKEREERERMRELQALEQKRKVEAQGVLLEHLLEVLNQAEALSLDALVEKWDAFVKEEKAVSATGIEKSMLVNRLDNIADYIQEKKWQNLIQEKPENLAPSLHGLLDERHKARRKLKETLEEHRKIVGGSGLSLEHSMLYQELIGEEKMRLDAIETMIEEIEEQLFDVEE